MSFMFWFWVLVVVSIAQLFALLAITVIYAALLRKRDKHDWRQDDRAAKQYLRDSRKTKGYAQIRAHILEARADIDAYVTADGKKLRANAAPRRYQNILTAPDAYTRTYWPLLKKRLYPGL